MFGLIMPAVALVNLADAATRHAIYHCSVSVTEADYVHTC